MPPALALEAPTGQLSFVDREGRLFALDLAADEPKRFTVPKGAIASGLALGPSGKQLAYVAEPLSAAAKRQIVLLDVPSGEQHTLEPERADYVGDLSWGGSGTLLYRTYAERKNGKNHYLAIAEGAKTSRLITRDAWLRAAGQGEGIAYAACMGAKHDPWCTQRLVVDAVAGGRERVLAENRRFEPFGFTPDGRYLLTVDRIGEAQHLVRYDVEGGAALDLGAIVPLQLSEVFGAWISHDSREALARRGDTTVAIMLDGSGERVITKEPVRAARFVGPQGVLYEITKNLAPGNDVPNNVLALGYLEGERRVSIADFARCSWPTVSRSGRLVARACEDGIHIYSLETGKEVRAIPPIPDGPGPSLLGFDGREVGLVVAYGPGWAARSEDHVLRLHRIDGGADRELGTAYTHAAPNDRAGWPAFAFMPGDG